MSMAFSCAKCGKGFQTDPRNAGKTCKCKHCGHVFVIQAKAPGPAKARQPSPPEARDEPDDPYGIEETAPLPARAAGPALSAADEEEFRGPRVRSLRPKKSSRSSGGSYRGSAGFFGGFPPVYFLVAGGVAVASFLTAWYGPSSVATLLIGLSALVALIPLLYGEAGMIIVPSWEGVFHGVLSWLIWPYRFYYVATRWEDMQGVFLTWLGAIAILVVGCYVPAHQMRLGAASARHRMNLPPGVVAPTDETTVTVEVSGLADRDTEEYFHEQIGELKLGNMVGGGAGNHTYTIWPVKNPETVAERLTEIARVVKVDERTIHVEARPRTGPRRPSDDDPIAQALFDLQGTNESRRGWAINTLRSKPPVEEQRAEVLKAMETLITDPDASTRSGVVDVLKHWKGPDAVPILVKALKDREFSVVWNACDALGEFKDPAAIEPLAACLASKQGRDHAVSALRKFGPQAEPAVVGYLSHGDADTRKAAAEVLNEIGSAASIPALEELIRKNNDQGFDCMAAGSAISAIKRRGSEPPSAGPRSPADRREELRRKREEFLRKRAARKPE